VAVATLMFDPPAARSFIEPLIAANVPVHPIPLSPRAYLRERRAIAQICGSWCPDVVHTHGYRTDVVDRGVAARLGIGTMTTVHGPSFTGGLKGAFYEWLQRRNYRRFDAVVAVSRALSDSTRADGVAADRLHHIPNAWGGLYRPLVREDARRELDLPADATVVGWVGRMIPVKAGELFLEALHRLPQPRPIGVMIGHGSEADRLRRRAAELGLGPAVRMYSAITDAGRLFPAFDTYVLSSRSEGIPVVVLEAMAARTPIVATRVGGVPEMVGEQDAWLVPPGDAEALARAIAASLADREAAAQRVERAARRLATEFGVDRWLDRYEAVYRSVVLATANR
jgi:glycosyltransferase involved in cell wall biosynthesis